VRDDAGNEHLVHARLEAGAALLDRGAQVLLVDYDEPAGLFSATDAAAALADRPVRVQSSRAIAGEARDHAEADTDAAGGGADDDARSRSRGGKR
jgi:hypothetical protein